MTKSPTEIDRHVGSRVRLRRMLLKMSQEMLGEALGVTFQQVQKYEKGKNRIGASRLLQIANVLGVTPSYFFEDLREGKSTVPSLETGQGDVGAIMAFIDTPQGIELNRAFVHIDDPLVRRNIVSLVSQLAESKN